MTFLNLAKKRYSVRDYSDKKVEEEKINLILEAARVAPTAANKQPHKILVLNNNEAISKLRKGCNPFNANLAFVICGNKERVWIRPQDGKDMIDVDTSIITDHMMLQATDLELGTLWMTWFDPEIIKSEFNIPAEYVPVNILLAGYPVEVKDMKDRHDSCRLNIEDFVSYNSF